MTQGWAIRGWNNQEGANRLKALFDVVPKGQVSTHMLYAAEHMSGTVSVCFLLCAA